MDDELPKEWITKREAARWLGISERTIDNWRKKLGLPCRKIGGIVRFKVADLRTFLEGRSARVEG